MLCERGVRCSRVKAKTSRSRSNIIEYRGAALLSLLASLAANVTQRCPPRSAAAQAQGAGTGRTSCILVISGTEINVIPWIFL